MKKINNLLWALDNIFGFMYREPLYVSLQKMKVVYIATLALTCMWIDELLNKIPEVAPNADAIMLGIYFSNFVALVGILWKFVVEIRKPTEVNSKQQ